MVGEGGHGSTLTTAPPSLLVFTAPPCIIQQAMFLLRCHAAVEFNRVKAAPFGLPIVFVPSPPRLCPRTSFLFFPSLTFGLLVHPCHDTST